jgi:hypothetical protein
MLPATGRFCRRQILIFVTHSVTGGYRRKSGPLRRLLNGASVDGGHDGDINLLVLRLCPV